MLVKGAISHERLIPLPFSDFYEIVRKRYLVSSQNILRSQTSHKGSRYFELHPDFSTRPWFHKFKIKVSRENIFTISRLIVRANHYALHHSLHWCNIVRDPRCACGFLQQGHFLELSILFRPKTHPLERQYIDIKNSLPMTFTLL